MALPPTRSDKLSRMDLRATPRSEAARLAVEIYAEVLTSVKADRLLRLALECTAGVLMVQGQPFDLSPFRHVRVVAVGKAAAPMAREAAAVLGGRFGGGLIITKEGYGDPVEGFELLEAGHPLPDARSLEAGRRVLEFANACDEHDFVLFLLSGGASALMEAPEGDITLEDLRRTTDLLLLSGADIRQLNAVRSRISAIKAGGLARAFAPATVVALVLSDVVGNSLETIG